MTLLTFPPPELSSYAQVIRAVELVGQGTPRGRVNTGQDVV